MSNTPTPTTTTTTTLRLLSAVNEAVIGHENDDTHLTGSLLDVALTVREFARHFATLVPELMPHGTFNDDLKGLVRSVVKATETANGYLDRLESSGHSFVHSDLDVLRTANDMVAAVMSHDELIGA